MRELGEGDADDTVDGNVQAVALCILTWPVRHKDISPRARVGGRMRGHSRPR